MAGLLAEKIRCAPFLGASWRKEPSRHTQRQNNNGTTSTLPPLLILEQRNQHPCYSFKLMNYPQHHYVNGIDVPTPTPVLRLQELTAYRTAIRMSKTTPSSHLPPKV
jgi:hypothetical protein